MANVPCKNPLKYCRLCLSEDEELILMESGDKLTTSSKLLLQKLFLYMKITFHNEQDYPSAICYSCLDRFDNFHDFRRMVVRNHNAVKTFRRLFGDQYDEEPTTMIEVIDDSQQEMEIKQEFEAEESKLAEQIEIDYKPPKEEVKEVDVYHLDGELKTVVVKEERLSPEKSLPATPEKEQSQEPKRSPPVTNLNANISRVTVLKRPQGKVLNLEHAEKRAKAAILSRFSVVKCSHCRAVFRNRENLLKHERDDHQNVTEHLLNKNAPSKSLPVIKTRQISKPLPHSPVAQLFKCPHCSSSFIQKSNYEQHIKTCKAAALSKLNPQIVVKRTTPAAMNEVIKAAVAKIGRNVQVKPVELVQVKQEETEDQRIRCHYCPLTYKTKYFLKKHMLDVHKIDDYENVFYCHVCKLNYSCDEDLQLHNRAIHRFQCKQCLEDFRTCMHAQTNDTRTSENGIINKGI